MATVTATLPKTPYFLQADSGDADIFYSGADFRDYTNALVGVNGVLSASSFVVGQSSPVGWSVTVSAGSAKVGGYVVKMSSATTVSLLTFNTNPAATRTHKVWLCIYDGQVSGEDYDAKLVVTEDTGSGAPTPTGTAAYTPLGTVAIANGQSNVQDANIGDLRAHAAPGEPPSAITLQTGFTDASTAMGTSICRAKYMSGQVTLSGAITKSGGFAVDTTYTIGFLAKNFWPNRRKYLLGAAGNDTIATVAWRLTITTGGNLIALIPGGTGPGYLFLDGITFDID